MFSASALKNQTVAKEYFDEHLSHNDYYTEGEVEPGRWIGLGAEQLGLEEGSIVNRAAFLSLCEGQHPSTNQRLTQRQNAAGRRRVLFDFTCSAPKSVSIMAVTMNDPRLVEAHQEAARVALKELECFAAARIRVQGANADRTTGNVVGAEFLHDSSRALDPQLHTHFTLFNATFDTKENRWKALQTSDIFAASRYGTEVYRHELIRRVRAIGYETEGFEIKGVSEELKKRFSKRSAERDEVIARMEERLGRTLSDNEVSRAVHQSRSRKIKGIKTAEVREKQLAQMSPEEIAALRLLREPGVARSALEPIGESAALDYATAHVFERASVVPETELLRCALVHGRGQVDLNNLKSQVAGNSNFIRVGKEISTREILTTELFLIEKLNAGQDAFVPLAPGYRPVNFLMRDDQRRAIAHVLQSSDQFTGFRGLAGAGKTTALQEIDYALREHSRVFCAPTAAATEVLRGDGFEAVTLKALLVDPKKRNALSSGSVIVLDEAGLVSLGDMRDLFALATEKGARVIFSGDTGQHSGVARGDALRLLEEHSLYRFGQLDHIRRQKQTDYREAVELAARKKPQEAFERLESLGCVHEPEKLYESAANAYLEARQENRSALLVAPTWAEIESVTNEVRAKLKERNLLSSTEESVPVFDSQGWTEAQKSHTGQYQAGQRILFQRRTSSFRANEEVEVLGVGGTALRVRRADGREHRFNPRSSGAFDVGQRREIPLAPGDQILLQANRRLATGSSCTLALVNGQVATIKAVQGGQITLADGRTLPPDYRQFTHGYCVTSHAAQARTVDSVFLVASSRSAAAIHQEQFYVSISRGRKECRIFTDDKVLLRDRITRSTHRQAALDLLRSELARAGFTESKKTAPSSGRPPKIRPLCSLLRHLPSHHLLQIAQRFWQAISLAPKQPQPAPIAQQKSLQPPAIRRGGPTL